MEKPVDTWNIPCSEEEENYGFTEDPITGNWEPPAQDILELYGKLSKGDQVEFEWKCLGKRPPTPDVKTEDMTPEKLKEKDPKEDEKLEPTEFDFDEMITEENPITPRRTPASGKAPKSQKRVARMDKIMDDIFRHKKLNQEAQKQTSKQRPEAMDGQTPPHKQSPRGSPRASPRGSPKPVLGGRPDTPQRDSPKGRMSPKKLSS